MTDTGRILYSERMIHQAVKRIAFDVSVQSLYTRDLVVVCILKGGAFFATDLVRALYQTGIDVRLDFLWLSRYHGNTEKDIFVHSAPSQSLDKKNVLLADDVLDKGRSMKAALGILMAAYTPNSIRTAVLVDKPLCREEPIRPDFCGFTLLENLWIAGYGMDDEKGNGRACSDVYVPRQWEEE